MKPLLPADVSLIEKADWTPIVNALGRLRGTPEPSWLDPSHPHQNGSMPKRNPRPNDALVLQTIAARGPLHVTDAASFLARSMAALLSGDVEAARHLAYYGELRAALSILASEGIGVFNHFSVVVDLQGTVHPLALKAGTHQACWLVLRSWAQRPSSFDRIAETISINGAPLSQALTTFFPSPARAVLAADLMEAWGFDLAQGLEDRDQRNDASYLPSGFAPTTSSPRDDLELISAIWRGFEPGSSRIQRHMLRRLLEKQANTLDQSLASRETSFEGLDDRVRSTVSFDFLTRVVEATDHPLLRWAADHGKPASARSMITRSAMLLRIGMGLTHANLNAAGVKGRLHRHGWWSHIGATRGFWPPNAPPHAFADLWADVAGQVADAEQSTFADRHDLLDKMGQAALPLCGAERIALWTLFP